MNEEFFLNVIEKEVYDLAASRLNAIGTGFLSQADTFDICKKHLDLELESLSRNDLLFMFGAKFSEQSNVYEHVMEMLCPYTTLVSPFMTPPDHLRQIIWDNQLQGLVGVCFVIPSDDEDDLWMSKIFASNEQTLVVIRLGL